MRQLILFILVIPLILLPNIVYGYNAIITLPSTSNCVYEGPYNQTTGTFNCANIPTGSNQTVAKTWIAPNNQYPSSYNSSNGITYFSQFPSSSLYNTNSGLGFDYVIFIKSNNIVNALNINSGNIDFQGNSSFVLQSTINQVSNGNNKLSSIYVKSGNYNLTQTLLFPNTLPMGFQFETSPSTIFNYYGSGKIIQIDSSYLADYKFGILNCNTYSDGVRIEPVNIGPNGQNVFVVSSFSANRIFYCNNSVVFDNNNGSIANSNFYVNSIISAVHSNSNSSITNSTGFKVIGNTSHIFQGNHITNQYLQSGGSGNGGKCWTGVLEGSALFNWNYVNANNWNLYGVDGENRSCSIGIDTFASNDSFYGSVEDFIGGTGILFDKYSGDNIISMTPIPSFAVNQDSNNNIILEPNHWGIH